VQAVPWADEAEQKFSRLDPSMWELPGDVCTSRAGLQQASGREPGVYLKFKVARQVWSPILCGPV